MDTRSTVHAHEPGKVDDPAVAGPLESETESGAMPALQQPLQPPGTPPQSGGGLRDAHSRLAELLLTAASILEKNTQTGGARAVERGENRRQTTVPAIDMVPQIEIAAISGVDSGGGGSQVHHMGGGTQPPLATSFPSDGHSRSQPEISAPEAVRPTEGAAIALYNSAVRDHHRQATEQTFQQRLPVLTAFTAEGGDWVTFQRRFLAHQEMSGWSDNEALRALPATMDDDALATLVSAPRSSRSTLAAVLRLMATVYGPPSVSRHHFHDRRKGAKEMTLAYHTALLALAKVAFPQMDYEGINAMVMEKLLALAQELGIVVLAADEADKCSLRVATNIHAHELLKRNQPLIAAAYTSECSEPQDAQPSEEAFAATCSVDWRLGGRPPQHPAQAGATETIVSPCHLLQLSPPRPCCIGVPGFTAARTRTPAR
ncbi:uncharacterized protein LOC142931033 [Petromyzon marinus]|uniref:uncharacterized protein LOC142931033 n=1 Tax=Petromyzon marinus TaxID=7757 RepID=UPI003F6E49EA